MTDDTEIKVEEQESQPEALDELVPAATIDTPPDMIPCPICGELIITGATKCRHCGDYLDQGWVTKRTKWLGGKSLWDVAGLIVIPLTLAIVGFFLASMQDSRQLEIEAGRISAQSTVEANRAMSNTLQSYLDDMSTIVLEKDLEDEKVQSAIRARTVSTISELDYSRNEIIVEFLRATRLLDQYHILQGANLNGADLAITNLIAINLSGADLSGADLNGARLNGANLSGAYLGGADLNGARLNEADLSGAYLGGADLTWANLHGASLRGANLRGIVLNEVNLSMADLREADLTGGYLGAVDLSEARYTNTTKWPDGFDPIAAGAINDDEEE